MTLKSKFVLYCLLLGGLMLSFGGLSIWNLSSLLRASRSAGAEYEALDRASATAVQVGWLRDVLRQPDGATYRDARFFTPLSIEINRIVAGLEQASRIDDGDAAKQLELATLTAETFQAASLQGTGSTGTALAAARELDRTLTALTSVSKLLPGSARRHVSAASDRLLQMLTWSVLWLLIALIVSVFIHWRQYRTLVRPILALRNEMSLSAHVDQRHRITTSGTAGGTIEFLEIATYYNRIIEELSGFYHDLEAKVLAKSRELVRSERLASVGYLAAGVAHEINNPLSVISGYAELSTASLKRLLEAPEMITTTAQTEHNNAISDAHEMDIARQEDEAQTLVSLLEAQEIVRQESFRCKEITNRLLSLSRGGQSGREAVGLDVVAQQVALLAKGLRDYRDRKILLDFQGETLPPVEANITEMKQVLLNLTVNALDAVPPESGEVRIGGRRRDGWVEIFVEDNGKGMTRDILEQIFEPFFTNRRGVGEPGTGLGLSITQAIVESHGGRISAESRGPGLGSRFTFKLPAAINHVLGSPLSTMTPA